MKNQNDYLGQTKAAYCTDEGIKEFALFESLEWVSAPLDIDNRKLVAFLNNDEFIYVNNEKELVWVKQDICGKWKIKTIIGREELTSFKNIFDIEYDSTENAIICYEREQRVYVKL